MQYQDIIELIDSTLNGRADGHEILPLEHQNIITAVLEYARQIETTGQSILQGFAYSNTVPATPDEGKLCYIAVCPSNSTTTFASFPDADGVPLAVTCDTNTSKVAILMWNTEYWEKQEISFNVRIGRVIDGGDAEGNTDN